jgi:UDP-N-acetyl-D-mannosaminuronic acid dehydrogenase
MMSLEEAIHNRTATVAVIGLGYVGLPVACSVARAGFRVLGIERDHTKVALLRKGISPISGHEPGLAELLAGAIDSGRMKIGADYQECRQADVLLIAVETPVDRQSRAPNYEALRGAISSMGPHLQAGALVIVESTIAPGTMERVVRPLLEEVSGLKADRDFFLSCCPERVMPGKLLDNLRTCNRVVGGTTPEAALLARELYSHFVDADLDLTDTLTAELVKATENAYRDVQIAFANEIALLCENVGADVFEVRRLVNKSPLRAMHVPGAGVGGHCIPKDPWLLLHGTQGKLKPSLIPTARNINDGMPLHMVRLAEEGLAREGKAVRGARIAVLGYAYLENTSDARNSPTTPVVNALQVLGATVTVHDPHFEEYSIDLKEAVSGSDCVILMVAHDEYRRLELRDLKEWVSTPVLVDGRNVWDKTRARDLGFSYAGVGNR